MGKQAKKPTLRDKKMEGTQTKGNKGETSPAKVETRIEKPKGPVPDFKQNFDRENHRILQQHEIFARQHQQEADEHARQAMIHLTSEARKRFPDFVAGVKGTYLIPGDTGAFHFVITPRWFTAKNGKPGADVLVIEEFKPLGDTMDPVYIPHAWLTKNPRHVFFAQGPIGDIQANMLDLFTHAMPEEIASLKAYRASQHMSPEMTPTVETVTSTEEPSNVVNIMSKCAFDTENKKFATS